MKTPTFDEEAIHRLANSSSYERGEDYYAAGAVQRLILEGDTYRAYVWGSQRYTVRIRDCQDGVQSSCTCPYDWGGICKHIVAVMLAILHHTEGDVEIKEVAPAPAPETVRLDDILAGLAAEQLRAFVRLQAEAFPQLVENLQIFAQGTTATDKTVEAYQAEITAALQAADFQAPEDDYDRFDYHDRYDESDEDAEDAWDTLDGVLKPFGDMAQKYQAQGNWIEHAKIQEAIVRACGRIGDLEQGGVYETAEADDDAGDDEDDDDADAYDEDNDLEYVASECQRAARQALLRWAEALADATPEPDKQQQLERFLEVFAGEAYAFLHDTWEAAFKTAVCSRAEATSALAFLDRHGPRRLDQEVDKAGALLHLLDLSGDSERFVRLGQQAIQRYPHLALPLGEKLLAIGRRSAAIEAAETALKQTRHDVYGFSGHDSPREDLLRFLARHYSPEQDYPRLVVCAQTLLFEENQFEDYLFLRDLLRTAKERDDLIRDVKNKCEPAALIEILSAEERWQDLLDCAHKHKGRAEFPKMIAVLQERFAAECFALYRQVLLETADSGTGARVYRQTAAHARRMQQIPGHAEAFAKLMAEIVDKYSRRTGLMQELGELAALGRAWRDQVRKERVTRVTPRQMQRMGLDELAQLCPIGEDDRSKLQGTSVAWQRSNAALVWAILIKHGGSMDAEAITAAIAAHRQIPASRAAAYRSGGLRVLDALGYVEIARQGHTLRQVRLVKTQV